jgi:hypothetical protein
LPLIRPFSVSYVIVKVSCILYPSFMGMLNPAPPAVKRVENEDLPRLLLTILTSPAMEAGQTGDWNWCRARRTSVTH